MIKSALVAMTILGCNCEQNTCEYIRTAGVPSLSMSECQSAHEDRDRAHQCGISAGGRGLREFAGAAAGSACLGADGNAADGGARARSSTAEQPRRSILVRTRERFSAITSTARDGLGNAAEFVTLPVGWVRRQISAVEELRW